jgi:hypothetical protein
VGKLTKCKFGQPSVYYLSHIVDEKGVGADPKKVEAMVSWPKPTSIKTLRGFLGLTSYYRQFVWRYGIIVAPLTAMLKKNAFYWSSGAELALKKLKQVM